MKLSVILIAHDMAREIPRTLQSLSRTYQLGVEGLEYEVLLVDNGSHEPLNELTWADIDVPVHLVRLNNAPKSPARAINVALTRAVGDIVCLMVDGAHMLTPGVFRSALSGYRAFDDAVVAIRYFYLGIEEQTVSVAKGYDQFAEDRLLERIQWPESGYRLYEIGTPLRSGASQLSWFNRIFESNCLFMKRDLFLELGGADERFDLPGGGFLNIDIFKRAVETPGVSPIQIIGEGSFHQIHGGVTTNSAGEDRQAKLQLYKEQYAGIRGHERLMADVSFLYLGHMPTTASNITALERKRARMAGKLLN